MLRCYKVVLRDQSLTLFTFAGYIFRKSLISANQTQTKKTKSHFPDELLFIYVAPLAPKLAERIYILPQVYNANLCFLAVLSLSSTMPTEQ